MSITKDFDNQQWFETRDGDGTIVTSEGGLVVTCKATGIGRAYKKYYLSVMPGETVTFSCFARNRPQDSIDGFARIFIDNVDGDEADFLDIRYDDANTYTVSVTIDFTATGPQRVFFGLGVFGAIQGSADFWEPTIHRTGSNIVMQGVFQLPDGGGITLREDYTNYNIGTITWIEVDQTYRIEPDIPFNFSDTEISPLDIQFRPVLSLTGAPDGNMTEVYTWTGSVTNNVSWVRVQACAAAPVNLSTSTNQDRFFSMIVTMQGGS